MWTSSKRKPNHLPYRRRRNPRPQATPFGAPSGARSSSSPARNPARLGSSLQIKGHITGTEDLQIDGKVEGSITLRGHQLTVGSTAQLNSEIHAAK